MSGTSGSSGLYKETQTLATKSSAQESKYCQKFFYLCLYFLSQITQATMKNMNWRKSADLGDYSFVLERPWHKSSSAEAEEIYLNDYDVHIITRTQ